MTIQEFFALSAGKWFSQRTTHQLATQKSDHSKSNIVIELLAADLPVVQELCASAAWGGVQVVSQPVSDWSTPKNAPIKTVTTVLVPTADGQVSCMLDHQKLPIGTIALGVDEALTISLHSNEFSITERIWFASPNLRLRSIVQENAAGIQLASFCSEIRLVSS